MKIKKIENVLSEVRNHPEMGAISNDRKVAIWSLIDEAVSTESNKEEFSFGVGDLKAVPGMFTDLVARPIAFVAMVFVMVLGGWIGGVNASLETLPGDTLYPIKLASERAQLTLASSGAKARLHAEFATRRVNEVAKLVQSDDNDKAERIQEALDGFQVQMDGVGDSLKDAHDDDEVVELARVIEQKSDELEAVLEMSDEELDVDSTEAIVIAVEGADEDKSQAVSVLVEKSQDSSASRAELGRQFRNELRNLMSEKGILLNRFERALKVAGERGVDLGLEGYVGSVEDVDFNEAMNFAGNGGYDRAFSLLADIDGVLRDGVSAIIDAEIVLSHGGDDSFDAEMNDGSDSDVVDDCSEGYITDGVDVVFGDEEDDDVVVSGGGDFDSDNASSSDIEDEVIDDSGVSDL